MRISDWSSDVCSSDLVGLELAQVLLEIPVAAALADDRDVGVAHAHRLPGIDRDHHVGAAVTAVAFDRDLRRVVAERLQRLAGFVVRSEEHTSELQSLMRISYAVFCLKKKNKHEII